MFRASTLWSIPLLVACLLNLSVTPVVCLTLLLSAAPEPFALHEIDSEAVEGYRAALARVGPGHTLEVHIDSLGGDSTQLFRLLGLTDWAHHSQIQVVCKVYGVAMSAAAFFLTMGCDRRIMGPKAILLYHEAYAIRRLFSPLPIDPVQLAKETESLKSLNRTFAVLIAQHSHISEADYEGHVSKGDWYVLPEDALKYGFVDTVQ